MPLSFIVIPLIASYLIGSIPFAIVVSKIMKLSDPRAYGSYNAGATNVLRSGNKLAALFTLILDYFKGLIVVISAYFIYKGVPGKEALIGLCGLIVVVGHIFPIFFKFRGGRGVATAIGVFSGINIYLTFIIILTWLIVFGITRISALAALSAFILTPIFAYLLMQNSSYFGAITLIAILVIVKHKDNIKRLVKSKEYRFSKVENHQSQKS